ncbi:hypothetical protein FisN_7Lh029 [Fistulifera solaris]|uniref:Transmembrane protein n=1 Tax=Fistulifera solaris TaxID=1519565 RepID=A0A1Z5JCD4_FISSO|nr:hypothetical protein FisN_7Lh029 [Fistulifera solaris]|eukprot:GAX11664.1 hypothetical protein FisN_7Lh029 [Fistulifera solaris]
MHRSFLFALCFLFCCASSWSLVPFVYQQQRRQTSQSLITQTAKQTEQDEDTTAISNNDTNDNKGPLAFLLNPYESKIPKEIEKDIYDAEAKTPAAQDRQKRIAGYIVICFLGVLGAFFNAFLSELRMDVTLEEAGFGWVEQSNVLIRFFFLNKIGGGLLLLGGAGAGLLAEAEYDTRRLQAERIFEEMQRRRAQKNKSEPSSTKKKKRRENKRLNALAEIVEPLSTNIELSPKDSLPSPTMTDSQRQLRVNENSALQESKTKDGLLGTIQNFYERADSMAATQALLLNKKLEDEGLIEKITDESGLKVIGRDAAQKVQKKGDKEN